MGDEIRIRENIAGRRCLGWIISGLLYIGATLTLLVAVGKNDISVLQGLCRRSAIWPVKLASPGSSLRLL